MRLLIIDDDVELVATLSHALHSWYLVDVAYTAERGEYLAAIHEYDAMIVDFNLPDGTGVELCTKLRADNCKTPILMLTGRGDVDDKVLALDGGVDDYLTKPFSTKELLARIRALFRRNPLLTPQTILQYGDITIDINSGAVKKANQEIHLRRKERQILEFFVRHRGQIIKRDMLLEHIWDETDEPNTNAIDVHIRQLRKKLLKNSNDTSIFIKSIYGLGYQLN
jgi:OmpR-family two-component system manganese-sensing response regulator